MHDIRDRFKLIEPTSEQRASHATVRETAITFATILSMHVPTGSRLERALEKIEEAVFLANRGISEKGLEPSRTPHIPGSLL